MILKLSFFIFVNRILRIFLPKELSLWNKIKYLNLNIFWTRCCKPSIFQTQIIWSYRIHSLKYLRSATFGYKDIVIRKSEFVAKIQFLCQEENIGWIANSYILMMLLGIEESFETAASFPLIQYRYQIQNVYLHLKK